MATPRRNGQLSSCERCRISKLRCDHSTSPACGRCVREGRAESCVYHPAPMTRPKEPKPPAPRKSRKKRPESTVPSTSRGDGTSFPEFSLLASLNTPELQTREPRLHDWRNRRTTQSTSGFLGLTSTVTAFHTDGYNLPLEGTSYLERPLASYNLIGPSRSQIEQGAHVLLLLEHLSLFRGILESPFQVWDAILVGPPFVRQLWETFEELFESSIRHASDKAAAALQLSEQFFENTSKPITTSPSMTFTEYVSQIARRWESVGIFFCRTGLVCTFIPGDDSVFRQEGSPIGDKKGYYALTVKVSTLCLQFCDTFDLVSDPLCWLAFQSNLLLSQTHGMGDHRTWQRLGDLTTILFALGYHQLEPDSNVPFFLAELRKRAMVAAYSFDKKVAIFLGRPPRICERYCTLIPPLALKYEEMVAASEERDRALAKLDKHGLTTEGLLSGNASAQLRLMLSIQKENILELSLSPRTDNLIEKVDTLIGESNKLRAMLPLPGLLLDDQHKTTLDVSPESIHLEVMYLELLLYRTLVNRTGARLDALIQTSLEILDMLHILVAKQARNRKGTLGLGIQLRHIGLPAATVLTIELLRRSQPTSHTTDPSPTQFPRDEIIHKLTLIVLNLEAFVWPDEGDYEMVKQASRAISQALRHIRSPQPPVQPVSTTISSPPTPNHLTNEDMSSVDETDLMNWLENTDWGQDTWLDFS